MAASDDSSDSDDERKRKKHKKEKKEKKEKKSHKHKKHKTEHKSEPEATGSRPPGVDPISEDDYFARTREFQLWLQEARNTFLDELQGDEARRLFRKYFVDKWNGGGVSAKVYAAGAKAGEPAASRTI